MQHREEALNYALQFGGGLDTRQADRFVGMYVNDRTLDYGEEGREAVRLFLEKGTNSGLKVTLRKDRMYEFVDRLVNIALPRIKDFKGLSEKGFDKFGNYTFGIKEHIIFPEVNFDKVDKIRGLDITIVTTSKTKEGALELLKEFNFPLNNKKN